MNELVNRNSRNVSSFSVAAGQTVPVHVAGDYYQILAMSGSLKVSVNGGPFTPAQVGLIHNGVVGRDDVGTVRFYNDTGGAITVTVIHGKGNITVVGSVSIASTDLLALTDRLDAIEDDVEATNTNLTTLLARTPAAVTVDCDVVNVTNASTAFASKTSIKIVNIGATNITVTPAGGSARTLLPTEEVSWSSLRQQDVLKTITVDSTGGGDAKVVWTA